MVHSEEYRVIGRTKYIALRIRVHFYGIFQKNRACGFQGGPGIRALFELFKLKIIFRGTFLVGSTWYMFHNKAQKKSRYVYGQYSLFIRHFSVTKALYVATITSHSQSVEITPRFNQLYFRGTFVHSVFKPIFSTSLCPIGSWLADRFDIGLANQGRGFESRLAHGCLSLG